MADWALKGTADVAAAKTRFRTGGVGGSGITGPEAFGHLAEINPLTGLQNPEATQYAGAAPDLTNQQGHEVTVAQNLSGTAVSITYNTTDPTWNARVNALASAIPRLSAVLANPIPAFNVFLPKFGQTLGRAGGGYIQQHDAGNRAEFMFPDTVFLSPSTMIPTVDTAISYQETAKAVRKGKLAAMAGVPIGLAAFAGVLANE
jgi:hypothetical protein